ncbi:MAG: hypothetical protein ABSH20_07285 [Tepidisphaeraceae bacterium]|jgi:opacity protein-like surface antigen
MKRVIIAAVGLVVAMASSAWADQWYQVTFTGADIWMTSANNASQSRLDQAAPKRYRDWTQPSGSEVQATTYGVGGGVYDGTNGGFNAPNPGSGFAFDEINLWGKGGTGDWNETYTAVPGDTSWKVLGSPTGWTSGIVSSDPVYNPGPGSFPVWRSGTGAALSLANMNDPSFKFTFDVLTSAAALDINGKLRVFFGGYSDDNQNAGPDNYEVSGVMELTATQVPLPAAAWGGIVLLGSLLGAKGLKRLRRQQA